MNRRMIAWNVSLITLSVAYAAAASAQTFDHLDCQRIGSDFSVDITADIDAFDDRFDAKTCKLGKAKLLCGPAARTAVDPTPRLAFMQGQELVSDYLCYKIECDDEPAPVVATDLFGSRTLNRLRSSLLCVPAVREGSTPTQSGEAG